MSRTNDALKLHRHQARAAADRTHDLIIQIGGVRSGKTVTDALWMADRSAWDTAQLHALFTYTERQLDQQILRECYRWLDRWGIDHVRHRRPPAEWFERWRTEGTPTPAAPDRYSNLLVLDTGLHVATGTLHNRSYEQTKGAEWGSLTVEEISHGPEREAVEFLIDRVGCGAGPEYCLRNHLHTKRLLGNVPDDDNSWVYDFLATLEKNAAALVPEAERFTATEDNPYPHLEAGIGDAILIPSSTYDNQANLAHRYVDKLSAMLDSDTAKRRLGGLLRRGQRGRAYNAYDRENERPVAYDPDRTLYVAFDFNLNPAVAAFAHPLRPGEYPKIHEAEGVSHIGIFGEFFHVGGMDAYDLARAIVAGEAGSNGHLPANFGGLRHHRAPIIAFGDATANVRHMHGPNAWQIVDGVFRDATREAGGGARYSRSVPNINPLVFFRVRSVNAKLQSAAGNRALWIDPRCAELLADFAIVAWNKEGTDVVKAGERGGSKLWLRSHISDAVGYMVHQLSPLGKDPDPLANLPRITKRSSVDPPSFINLSTGRGR